MKGNHETEHIQAESQRREETYNFSGLSGWAYFAKREVMYSEFPSELTHRYKKITKTTENPINIFSASKVKLWKQSLKINIFTVGSNSINKLIHRQNWIFIKIFFYIEKKSYAIKLVLLFLWCTVEYTVDYAWCYTALVYHKARHWLDKIPCIQTSQPTRPCKLSLHMAVRFSTGTAGEELQQPYCRHSVYR